MNKPLFVVTFCAIVFGAMVVGIVIGKKLPNRVEVTTTAPAAPPSKPKETLRDEARSLLQSAPWQPSRIELVETKRHNTRYGNVYSCVFRDTVTGQEYAVLTSNGNSVGGVVTLPPRP